MTIVLLFSLGEQAPLLSHHATLDHTSLMPVLGHPVAEHVRLLAYHAGVIDFGASTRPATDDPELACTRDPQRIVVGGLPSYP
jgi:hypothetical protein